MRQDIYDIEENKIKKISSQNWKQEIYELWKNSIPLFDFLPDKSGKSSFENASAEASVCPTILKDRLTNKYKNSPDPKKYIPKAIIKLVQESDIPCDPKQIKRKHIPLFKQIQRLADKFRNEPLYVPVKKRKTKK